MGMFKLFNSGDTAPVEGLDFLQIPRSWLLYVGDGRGEYKDEVGTGRLGRAKGESKASLNAGCREMRKVGWVV
jgi:hypothetical protein